MNLLIVADDAELADGFADHVDTVEQASLADIRVNTGEEQEVLVSGEPIDDFDALYLEATPKIAIFSRVFLETLLEQDIATNLDPTALFILSKKSYLHQVLEERRCETPATAIISTEKGCAGIEEQLGFPVIGKKFEGFVRRDMNRIESSEELDSFVEHMDHGSHILILQEQVDGEVYDCLYIDGEIISIRLDGEGWRKRSGDAKQSYHSISSDLEETVADAATAIGADVCRIRLVGGHIVDAHLHPDLKRFKKITGKNVFGTVASYLAEGA